MPRFGVKEVANVMFINLVTNKVEMYLDTLKMSNLENANESSYASGGQGAGRLVGWDFGRTTNFVLQDALLNPSALAMSAGTSLVKKAETIHERLVVTTVSDGSATPKSKIVLPEIPDAGSIEIHESADGYGHDTDAVAQASITVVGKDVTVPTATLAIGKQVVVYFTYQSAATAEVISIKSDKFGGYYKVVGKTFWRSETTGLDEKVQIVIPKAKISSSFNLTMQPDGDPSVFDFNLDVFKDPASTDMVKLIRY